jgi:hypothetical protein
MRLLAGVLLLVGVALIERHLGKPHPLLAESLILVEGDEGGWPTFNGHPA